MQPTPVQVIPVHQLGGGEVMVNGTILSEDAIHQEMQYHPAATAQQARQGAARALAIRTLLLQEARSQGITGEDRQTAESADEACIRQLLARMLDNPEPDEAACRQYFVNNRSRFQTGGRYRVAHIFRPAPADDAEARVASRQRCRRIIQVVNGEADSGRARTRFQRLAMVHSRCPSAEAGGDLGVVGRGDTAREFEQALERLPVGEVAAHPLETRYGFHVVWLAEREPGQPLPFEAVQRQIADYLKESVWRRSVNQYLRVLAAGARLQGVDLDAADSPLMQ